MGFLTLGLVLGQDNSDRREIAPPNPATISSVLFGDIKVDNPEGRPLATESFTVILQQLPGARIYAQQTVGANGRYRFNDVRNGEYLLIVKSGNAEVVRESLVLQQFSRTDIRKDIELSVREGVEGLDRPSEEGVLYARSPENQSLYEEAQEMSRSERLDDAAKLLEQLVKSDPQDFEAWTDLGTTQFRREKLREAEEAYKEALELRPDFLLPRVNLGKVQFARKDYEGAIETLTRAVEAEPDRAETQQLLGECYLQIKQGSRAVGYLYEALRLDPKGWPKST